MSEPERVSTPVFRDRRGIGYHVTHGGDPAAPSYVAAHAKDQNGKRIGGVGLSVPTEDLPSDPGRPHLSVNMIEVDEAHRRQGVAQNLFQAVHTEFPRHVIYHHDFIPEHKGGRGGHAMAESLPPEWNRIAVVGGVRPTLGQTDTQRRGDMTTPEMLSENHDQTATVEGHCATCLGAWRHADTTYETMADNPGDPAHKAAHKAAFTALNRQRQHHWVVTGRRLR